MRSLFFGPWVAMGALAVSVAGQSSWVLQNQGSRLLLGVDAVDSMSCWASGGRTGSGAIVWRTLDGGRTWNQSYGGLDFAAMLMDIDMVDREVGFASGMGLPGMTGCGKTVDGGRTWTPVRPALLAILAQTWWDVVALDRRHVWAVGSWVGLGAGSGVSRSDNGGLTWQFVSTMSASANVPPRRLDMIDLRRGWLVSGWEPDEPGKPFRGAISATTDGGRTWKLQLSVSGWAFTGIDFVDATHGWATAIGPKVNGRIWHTTDGGRTWKLQPFPTQDQHMVGNVRMIDRLEGWAVGWKPAFPTGTETVLLHTTDGGRTWKRDPVRAPYGPLQLAMVNRGRGWTVGANNFQQSGILMRDAEELGSYGRSTPGCAGPLRLSAVSRPTLGNRGFAITVSPAPGRGAALLGVSPTARRVLGIELLVDLTGAASFPMGRTLALPVPNDPRLLGKSLLAQAVYPSVCGPQGLAATQGLVATPRR